MRKIIITALSFLIVSPALLAQTKTNRKDTVQHLSLYSCPMHKDVTSNHMGKCPKCGMNLTQTGKEKMKSDVLKNYTCPTHLEVTTHDPGKCPKCGKKLNLSPKEQMKTEVMKVYTCPMHPEVVLDKEGKCPKCGGALQERKKS